MTTVAIRDRADDQAVIDTVNQIIRHYKEPGCAAKVIAQFCRRKWHRTPRDIHMNAVPFSDDMRTKVQEAYDQIKN